MLPLKIEQYFIAYSILFTINLNYPYYFATAILALGVAIFMFY